MSKGADKRKLQHHSGKLCSCLFLHFCTVEKTVFFAKKEVFPHVMCSNGSLANFDIMLSVYSNTIQKY